MAVEPSSDDKMPVHRGRSRQKHPLSSASKNGAHFSRFDQVRRRLLSCPPPFSHIFGPSHFAIKLGLSNSRHVSDLPPTPFMISSPTVDLTFDDEEWKAPPLTARLYRAASVGNSWKVTSIGRGFDWDDDSEAQSSLNDSPCQPLEFELKLKTEDLKSPKPSPKIVTPKVISKLPNSSATPTLQPRFTPPVSAITSDAYFTSSPVQSRSSSPHLSSLKSPLSSTPPSQPRTPSSPRPRRRSSQHRVSLIAGRVSIAPIQPPSPPPLLPPSLHRTSSSNSSLHSLNASSTRAPSPSDDKQSFLGNRSISEFFIESEIGKGAYGLVKRAREIGPDGSLGPPLVIKQIIKSRILADCWKRHPTYGTIPIEIYVMSAISNTSYVLPPRRPWDPSRAASQARNPDPTVEDDWVEGKVVKGHPNICPLLDFFEDSHYYYLVLPSTTPERQPGQPSPPSDLFDLVETYPQGLPSDLVRSYLGQMADALYFLHKQGIVHRDVKDENVVLGPNGKCILIDFGSSGIVKKSGWDTFSGTLDYAGPEILKGQRYYGKEQDVWAFGVVAYVLLVGECPFMTAEEAQEGLESPFANASISLDDRCAEKETEGEEPDGGGALGDAAALVRACLRIDVAARPSFERILQCRFLNGNGGWGMA
ncbi:serine/threonine protein kinase [Pleurotus ostreatus]|nr:serine/threonine protein kinase [Pleurotus ostreatus]